MAKSKMPGWAGFSKGAALALVLYIAFQCLLALLTLKGAVSEGAAFRFQAVSGALAACAGGTLAIRRTEAGALWAALGSAAIFAAALVLGGMLACNGVVWSEESLVLLAAALAGGILAGMLGRGRGKKKKQRRAPPIRRAKAGKRN